MILNLRLAADSEVAALLAHPERIEDWLYGEYLEEMANFIAKDAREGAALIVYLN